MSFGIDELSRRILNGSLSAGGWPSLSDRANPSITVTSEMILALTEHLEYSKNPASKTESTTREEATITIKKALDIALSELGKRIDNADLSIWHFSMTLAATANARAFFLREGKDLEELDTNLISKILQKIDDLKNRLPDDLGTRWAYLRAIELITRTEHASIKDQNLWEIIEKDVRNFSASATTIRNNILSSGIDGKTAYQIAIIADICVDTLKSSSNPAESSLAKGVLLNAIRKIQEIIRGENQASEKFPSHKFFLDNTDPKKQDTSQYRVVTTATLASTFSYVIRGKNLVASFEKMEAYANFYSIVESLHEQIEEGKLWGYGPAHGLRTLAEIQINKRDSDAALEILRLSQKERQDFYKEKNELLNSKSREEIFDKSLRKQYESCFLLFGSPDSKYFAMCSLHMSWVLLGLLIITSVILFIFNKIEKVSPMTFISIPIVTAFFLLFWGIYAVSFEDYKTAKKTRQFAIWAGFLLSFIGLAGSIASIYSILSP